MKISISREITFDLLNKLEIVNTISGFFAKRFETVLFGKGVNTICIVVNCANPELGNGIDYNTGEVVDKFYIKEKRLLEFHFKLKYEELKRCHSTFELLKLISIGFKRTYNDIEKLNIDDFDIKRFYADFSAEIENFENNNSILSKNKLASRLNIQEKETNSIMKMRKKVFWEIIEQSKEQGNSYLKRVNVLFEKMLVLDQNQIIGFEFTLRDILALSAHYNILAAFKIIRDFISDDDFLYFRCRLLLEGRETYFSAIQNPETIAMKNINELEFGGEELLSISDQVYINKFGEKINNGLPRDIAIGYRNYDEGEEIYGECWSDDELPYKYPLLWGKYKR